MHEPATMRLCNNAVLLLLLLAVSAVARGATKAHRESACPGSATYGGPRSGALARCGDAPTSAAPSTQRGRGLHSAHRRGRGGAELHGAGGQPAGPEPEEGQLSGFRRRRKAEHHQFSAHRSAGFDRTGGGQLRVHVAEAAGGEQEHAGSDLRPPIPRTRPLS